MSDLPILDELRADLVGAMRATETAAPPRLRALRPLALVALALALLAASAAAATYYVLRASPIASLEREDVAPEQRVAPGTSAVLPVRSADPDPDAPPWTLRIARSEIGLVCGTIGQVVGGDFGIVGLDHRFRAVPEANADVCSAPDADGLALLGARVFDADRPEDVRTVVYGAGGPRLRAARVGLRGGALRPVEITAGEGAFVLAARGYPEDLAPLVELEWDGGRVRRRRLTASERPGAEHGAVREREAS